MKKFPFLNSLINLAIGPIMMVTMYLVLQRSYREGDNSPERQIVDTGMQLKGQFIPACSPSDSINIEETKSPFDTLYGHGYQQRQLLSDNIGANGNIAEYNRKPGIQFICNQLFTCISLMGLAVINAAVLFSNQQKFEV
ncbi:MAG: hypothetical protein ABIR19_11350 [Ginsengibacter sp.]